MANTAKKVTLEDAWEIVKKLGEAQKETNRQLKETDRRFNSQWGKLVESLVEGNIVEKFSQSMLTRKFMGPWPLLLPILNQINTQKTKSFLFSRPLEIVRLLLMPKVSNQKF